MWLGEDQTRVLRDERALRIFQLLGLVQRLRAERLWLRILKLPQLGEMTHI